MGIQGLIPFLKNASRHTNIRQFHGCTVAVDAYCWLHKGAFSVALKLAKGEKTDGYVVYCIKMVNMLLAAGVTPILVFDGQNLPSKEVTEHKRHDKRTKYKQLGKLNLIEGRVSEATECFQKCVEVTSQMARDLIKACRKLGVDCIVAPYEADAQLAYLSKSGIADIIITEDSDLALFGCNRVFFKMDMSGNGVMFESSHLHLCLGINADNFTFDKFRHMCILSGCDYLPSLPGIGLVKAGRFFSKTTNPNLKMILPKVPSYLNMPSLTVSKDYIEKFVQANNTFLHQLVFDPLLRKVVPLTPYPPDLDPSTLVYAGPSLSDEMAYHIALGNIDVGTLKKVDNYDPDSAGDVVVKSSSWNIKSIGRTISIWSRDYKMSKTKVPLESGDQPTPPSTKMLRATVTTPKTSTADRRNSTKRIFKNIDRDNEQTDNDDLLSLYKPIEADQKKVKCNVTPEVDSATMRSPLTSTDKNQKELKGISDNVTPVRPVVRSRFFSPTPVNPIKLTPPAVTHQFASSVLKTEAMSSPVKGARLSSPQDTDNDSEDTSLFTSLSRNEASNPTTPSPVGRLLFDRAFVTRPSQQSAKKSSSWQPAITAMVDTRSFPPVGQLSDPIRFTKLKDNLQQFKFGGVNAPFKLASLKPASILDRPPQCELTSSGSSLYNTTFCEGEDMLTPPDQDLSGFVTPRSTPESDSELTPPSSLETGRLSQLRRCLDEAEGLSEDENHVVVRSGKPVPLNNSFLNQKPRNVAANSKCRGQGLSRKKSHASEKKSSSKGQLSIRDSLAKFNFVKQKLI